MAVVFTQRNSGIIEAIVAIGMDVISKGDFVLTNHDEHSTFSFRLPSQKEIILK